MADNKLLIEQDVEVSIDPTGGPDSILAEDHQRVLKGTLKTAGKYTGFPFVAELQAGLASITGAFRWNGNNMNNTSNFDVDISKNDGDLNDMMPILDTLSSGDILRFKDYVGRVGLYEFVSYAAVTGPDGYRLTVKGLPGNPNYAYQAGESRDCHIEFIKQKSGSSEIDVQDENGTSQFPITNRIQFQNVKFNAPNERVIGLLDRSHFLYVDPISGDDATQEPSDIGAPMQTLNKAIERVWSGEGNHIVLIRSGVTTQTTAISISAMPTSGNKIPFKISEYYRPRISGVNEGSNFSLTLSNIDLQDIESCEFNIPNTNVTFASSLTQASLGMFGFKMNCRSLVWGINFGFSLNFGRIEANKISVTQSNFSVFGANRATFRFKEINITGFNVNFLGFTAGSSDAENNGKVVLDFDELNCNNAFTLFSSANAFGNSVAPHVVINHGTINSTRTAANNYIVANGGLVEINYKPDHNEGGGYCWVRGNNMIEKGSASLILRGQIRCDEADALFSSHSTGQITSILCDAIICKRLVNSNWTLSIHAYGVRFRITGDVLGVVGASAASTILFILGTACSVFQSDATQPLFSGAGAGQCTLRAPLYGNNTGGFGVVTKTVQYAEL